MKLNRITPLLPVAHVTRSLAFYQRLGFEVERQEPRWGWALLRFGECRLMLDESIHTAPDAPRMSVLYLYPDDIREFHATVRLRGLGLPELEATFYGHLEFRILDPDGNQLWIGQNLTSPVV